MARRENKYGVVVDGTLTEFTIYRDTWARGLKDPLLGNMLARYGQHCCVGFMSLACGVPNAILEGEPDVDGLQQYYQDMIVEGRKSRLALERAYALNDDAMGEKVRERKIVSFFKRTFNVKVRFEDTEPK